MVGKSVIIMETPIFKVTDLDKSCATVQIQMKILDLPKVGKLVDDIILTSFLMDVGDEENPAFHRWNKETQWATVTTHSNPENS